MRKILFSLLLLGFLLLGTESPAADQTLSKGKRGTQNLVEIYTTSWCPYCRKAEAFLKSQGVSYVNYDIDKDPAAAQRKQQLDSRKGVPLAVINGQTVYGFSERMYRTALELD